MTDNRVAFIANSLESAYKFHHVLADLGAKVSAGTTAQLVRLAQVEESFDLVVFEAMGQAAVHLGEICSIVEGKGVPLLVIMDESDLDALELPNKSPADFVVADAGYLECKARIMRLLVDYGVHDPEETISVDDMVINLNTYQVAIGGVPIDLTYLEYALLAFFVRHPSRAFSREALIQEVWGFDYLGGSRTVDVHVRRIRAKLGPGLAQHLETIRGVGYLWDPKG